MVSEDIGRGFAPFRLPCLPPNANVLFVGDATPTVTGYFKVYVNDVLVHSKKNSDGSPEGGKLQLVVEAVRPLLH